MPIIMEPRAEGHILYFKFVLPWTLAEFAQMMEKDQAFRDRARHKVHAIIMSSQSSSFPAGSFNFVRRSPTFVHRTRGQIVVIGGSNALKALGALLARTQRMDDIKFFRTYDEGIAYLQEIIARENQ